MIPVHGGMTSSSSSAETDSDDNVCRVPDGDAARKPCGVQASGKVQMPCTVNFAHNDTRRRGIKKVSLFAKCRYTRSLIVMYYSGMGLCSGYGNSVVIRELSLYPQSLLAKLTVPHFPDYKSTVFCYKPFPYLRAISMFSFEYRVILNCMVYSNL